MRKLPSTNEFYVAATIVLLSLVIGSVNPAFLTLGNLIDLLRSSMVMGIFGLGVLMVVVSGGIDVSFTAIASFSMFTTTKILKYYGFEGTVLVAFLIAAGIGLALGFVNAIFISLFRLPTMIVTLGTANMINGFLLAFIGAREISDIPQAMINFSKANLFEVTSGDGFVYGLPAAILILAILVVFVWFVLKYTMLGRGIYALGGDRVAAERVGFDIKAIQFFVYGFVGLISGIGGLVHTCLMRNSDPVDLIGTELVVIAAVVLGGARITGGHGTVLGTLLGLFLVTIITNSLILLGIPSYWQSAVVGMLILVGTGVAAYQSKKAQASHGLA